MVVREDVVEARDARVSQGGHVLTREESRQTGLPLAGPAAKGVPARALTLTPQPVEPNPNPNPNRVHGREPRQGGQARPRKATLEGADEPREW